MLCIDENITAWWGDPLVAHLPTFCYFAFGFTISDNKSGFDASRTRWG